MNDRRETRKDINELFAVGSDPSSLESLATPTPLPDEPQRAKPTPPIALPAFTFLPDRSDLAEALFTADPTTVMIERFDQPIIDAIQGFLDTYVGETPDMTKKIFDDVMVGDLYEAIAEPVYMRGGIPYLAARLINRCADHLAVAEYRIVIPDAGGMHYNSFLLRWPLSTMYFVYLDKVPPDHLAGARHTVIPSTASIDEMLLAIRRDNP